MSRRPLLVLVLLAAGSASAQVAPDTSLFAAAVRAVRDGEFRPPLTDVAVDPRPLLADSTLSLADVRAGALADAPAETERRRAVLQAAGIEEEDAVRDAKCVLAPGNGTPPPPDPNRPSPPPRPRTACNRPFRTLAFSLPRPAGEDERSPRITEGRQVIRAFLLFTSGYFVYDLTFEPLLGGGWKRVDARLRDGIMS